MQKNILAGATSLCSLIYDEKLGQSTANHNTADLKYSQYKYLLKAHHSDSG